MSDTQNSYVITVDSGGTFADCVVIDDKGTITTGKSSSTPQDFSVGILNSVQTVADKLGLTVKQILNQTRYFFGHGSTVALNALITRSGERTGLLTTKGFEDTLSMGRVEQKVAGLSEEERYKVYKLNKAEPIIPRPVIRGITERVDRFGEIVVVLNEEDLKQEVDKLISEGVKSIAVCYLWSFLNSRHEQETKRIINEYHPDIFVSISSELIPVVREYERMSTVAINSYISPITSRYLDSLHDKLKIKGLTRPLLIMQNIGGMADIGETKSKGVHLLSSGPVGGVQASRNMGDLMGHKNIICTDVGGTSFDVSLIVNSEMTIAPAPVFSKYTLLTPVIDITSIGAGGGSIARIEHETGLLKVGPQSAGGHPGPICYDLGGTEPTFTDANVALGRIDPDHFLGGDLKLNKDKAVSSIEENIARPLNMTVEQAALGIVEILTSHMADLIRKITIERGHDPADFVLFSFGGAGPLCPYGPMISGIKRVVMPAFNSVFSAFGMAGSDIVLVEKHSEPMLLPFDIEQVNQIYQRLEEKLVLGLNKNNISDENMHLTRSIDIRYRGQVHEITLPVAQGKLGEQDINSFKELFVKKYENKYGQGVSYGSAQLEAVTFEMKGTGKLEKPSYVQHKMDGADSRHSLKGERRVYFSNEQGYQSTKIYVREKLKPGNIVTGPAIIEAMDTTILVSPRQSIVVDKFLNIIMDL